MPTHSYLTSTDRIQTALDGASLRIGFNNPAKHNALSADMWQEIPLLIEQAEKDERIRLIVFAGTGEKAFAAGADITQFEDLRAAREAVTQYEAMAEAALTSIQNAVKPTLAAIRGYCIGGGLNIAIACDIRIAANNAVFSIPAAKLGLGYRHSALKNLVQLIGPGAAKDLFFTARRILAPEAHALGLVSRIADPAQLDELLAEYATAIAANAPLTIQAAKSIMSEMLKSASDFDADFCQKQIARCFESEDYIEGRRSFMEKRNPVFKGR